MKTKQEILLPKKDSFFYVDENEVDGHIDVVYDAMDEWAKEVVFDFLSFREKYKRHERDEVIKEQIRLGGIITWVGASDEKIYEEYLKSK